ncbi:MAG: hypothetical protein Q7R34_01435, partial [Dehalococcoidia bacterium]|nr:hypothetical protein [Dehalococcoidia bacterium]
AGPPFMSDVINAVVQRSLLDNGLAPIEVDILEAQNIRFLGIDISKYYVVKVYGRGVSPLPAFILPIIWGVLGLIGLALITWTVHDAIQSGNMVKVADKTVQAQQQITAQQEAALEVVKTLPPEQQAAALQKVLATTADAQKSLANLIKPPSSSTFEQIKTIALISVVGLGVIALLNSGILNSLAGAIPQRRT